MILSIITINLNNASGLRKTINSVITQTSKDFEYIIIDGGSTDGSVDIIKQFDCNISYWVSEPDTGIYNAMNKGINIAKGKYCQFLNSGDWLVNNNVVEKMLETIPNCSIVYGNKLKKINGKTVVDKGFAGKDISLLDLFDGTLYHSVALIKRSLFEKYGLYDESLKIVSDWKFYLVAVGFNMEKVVYKDINVSWFDMNGISSTNHKLIQEERTKVLNELLPLGVVAEFDRLSKDLKMLERLKKMPLILFIIRFLHYSFMAVKRILE